MAYIIARLGIAPSLPALQGVFPGGPSLGNGSLIPNPVGAVAKFAKKVPNNMPEGSHGDASAFSSHQTVASKISPFDATYSSQTEKVISNFLHNPILKEDERGVNGLAEQLHSENNMLQMENTFEGGKTTQVPKMFLQ